MHLHYCEHAATSCFVDIATTHPSPLPPHHTLQVLGIERYSIAHTQGSHHGHTRITRQAYLEGAAYVPLLKRSFNLYGVLEQETRQVGLHLFRLGLCDMHPKHSMQCSPRMVDATGCGALLCCILELLCCCVCHIGFVWLAPLHCDAS
jgi:hypothetical protein